MITRMQPDGPFAYVGIAKEQGQNADRSERSKRARATFRTCDRDDSTPKQRDMTQPRRYLSCGSLAREFEVSEINGVRYCPARHAAASCQTVARLRPCDGDGQT